MLAKQLQGAAKSAVPQYIEDVFSTWFYTGTGATQTITNGIDLSNKGGLLWIKSRNNATTHTLHDTNRGATKRLRSNTTDAEATVNDLVTSFNSNGFTLGADAGNSGGNFSSAYTYVSWTFRKQAKFFDIVTWTGNGGTSGRTIAHNLGSVPGCIIVKKYSGTAEDWYVYHRSLGNTGTLQYFCILNTTAAQDTGGFGMEKASNWTATQFALASGTSALNTSGASFVAYLFAHDAGGFGAAGTDNVISCGSFTTDGSGNATINLGYEPQWLLVKRSDSATGGNWAVIDNMVGLNAATGAKTGLIPNLSNAEGGTFDIRVTSTGFTANVLSLSATYIYIAIRRGPMRTPTSGTSVFSPIAATGSTGTSRTIGFVADMTIGKTRAIADPATVEDRLRGFANTNALGAAPQLQTSSTSAQLTNQYPEAYAYTNTTRLDGQYANTYSNVWWHFARAPGFFDVVCYTGVGASATLNHNLGVAPEMVIVKGRSVISNWETYLSVLGGTAGNALAVNSTAAKSGTPPVSSATTTTFTLNNGVSTSNGQTYVAYLFATVAGVSKVGSYTGNGSNQTINCGFTAGARFIMIKRTDSTGDWYVWDTARGIVSGNDPRLSLNSTAAEVTTDDTIDPDNSGFIVNQVAATNVNVNNATYIFLAIA